MTRSFVATALVLAAVACKTSPYARDPEPTPAAPPDRAYREGTAADRERMASALAQLDSASGDEFLVVARGLVSEGDVAVPPLLEALASGSPRTRARAAYVLGIRRDRRTIDALALAAASDSDPTVRCEAGASLVEMGDSRGFTPLVDGLEDQDARRRFRCIDVLAQATAGTTLGYQADGPLDERDAAVRRWRAWLEMRRADVPAPFDDSSKTPVAPGAPARKPGDDVPGRR